MKIIRAALFIILSIFLTFTFSGAAEIGAAHTSALPAFLKDGNNAWVAARGVVIRASASKSAAIATRTTLGDPVAIVSESAGWANVKHFKGKSGWVEKKYLSDRWIFVKKADRDLFLMEGLKQVETWPINLGTDPVGDKEKSGTIEPGHYRTPEGELYVARLVPRSQFYKAFLLSYPSIHHADRGLELGLITKAQHAQIVKAIEARDVPPQNTNLGSYVEIHGFGTGGLYDWTLGCIALKNSDMDILWSKIIAGTPVLVVP